MNKQPNHLASLIEKQIVTHKILPDNITEQLKIRVQMTQEFKKLMVECLPLSILEECYITTITPQQLTLAVSSNTAANHILYMQQAYVQMLKQQSVYFQNLEKINVIVYNAPSHQDEQASISNHTQIPKKSILSEKTKQTITQTAKLVISDPKLQKALKKLAEDP